MKQYKTVALGGTFDILHIGHLALLRKGFGISAKVIIGLTGDEFAAKKGKHLIHDYAQRYNILENTIKQNFPGVAYTISKLENDFGPAVLEKGVEALVVSQETAFQGNKLNLLRRQKDLPDVDVIIVPMVPAKDGTRISTSRIKNAEIDSDGNILD